MVDAKLKPLRLTNTGENVFVTKRTLPGAKRLKTAMPSQV